MNKTTLNSQKEKHSMLSLRRATLGRTPGRHKHRNFYPRSPCGERLLIQGKTGRFLVISIHALLAESDEYSRPSARQHHHFYPRSPCGERRKRQIIPIEQENFYPRSPCGERLLHQTQKRTQPNFYPRSPCGERPYDGLIASANFCISIHALLAESDSKSAQNSGALLRI